jgi:hypothetical protein
MKTHLIATTALLTSILAAACTDTRSSAPAPVTKLSTTNAALVRGDIAPRGIVAMPLTMSPPESVLSASNPGLPFKPFEIAHSPDSATRREYSRVIAAGQASGPITLPIDAPGGARVLVTSRNPNGSLPKVHIVDTQGNRLDRARDNDTQAVVGHRVVGDPGLLPQNLPEPGFASLSLPRRALSFDMPTKPGRVTLDIPAESLADGIELDVQQPQSPIVFSGAASEVSYAYGDTAEIDYLLTDGDQPVLGATLTGHVELPNGERIPGLTFEARSDGHYVAHLPLTTTETKSIGTWHVRAKATGISNGIEFERDIDCGFGYAPSHARMTWVHLPEIVRGADGLIDELRMDVDVESMVDDRLSAGAALVFKGADGVEHTVGYAQTSADVHKGAWTITIHFLATDLALSKVDGPFTVRDLWLMSANLSTTQHRLGRGLDIVTPAFTARELRYPTSFRPAVERSFDLGDLPRP